MEKVAFYCPACGSKQFVDAGQIKLDAQVVLRFACGHDLTQAEFRKQAIETAAKVAKGIFGKQLKPRR